MPKNSLNEKQQDLKAVRMPVCQEIKRAQTLKSGDNDELSAEVPRADQGSVETRKNAIGQ